MGGYQASFKFNLTDVLQAQGDHIADVHRLRAPQRLRRRSTSRHDAEEWWVQEVIAHRGKTNRNAECTPGYYNFEGEFNRRQDGNYNGGFPKYIDHMSVASATTWNAASASPDRDPPPRRTWTSRPTHAGRQVRVARTRSQQKLINADQSPDMTRR